MSEDGVLGNGRIFFSALSKETVSSICSVFFYFQRECPLSRNRISSAFQNPKVYFAWLFTIIVLVLSTLASLVQSILLLVDCEINLSIKLLHNIVTTLGNPFKRYPLMLHSTQALSRLFLVIFYFLLLHY